MKKIVFLIVLILSIITLSGCCLSHDWVEATCTEPKMCTKCEKTEGEPFGHEWIEATCSVSQTCSVCGTTEGDALGHLETEYVVISEATVNTVGEKAMYCERCNELIDTEQVYYYDFTNEEIYVYSSVLDTFYSLQTIHVNPNSFDLKGARVTTYGGRTTIKLSFKGGDGKIRTDYFWKDTDDTIIKNRFGIDNYEGQFNPTESLNLEEIEYFEKTDLYNKKISSSSDIYIS